jgi:hypothetical protein
LCGWTGRVRPCAPSRATTARVSAFLPPNRAEWIP